MSPLSSLTHSTPPSPLGTLHIYDIHHPGAHRALRILATAALAKRDIALADNYNHGETNLTPQFRAKWPTGQVPAFETHDGHFISEGSAIALYVALSAPEAGLLGEGIVGQALVAQWQGFVDFSILNNLIFVYGQHKTAPRELVQAKLDAALAAVGKLEVLLSSKKAEAKAALLVGEKITLADIAVVSGLVRGYQGVFDRKVQEQYPNVFTYVKTILAYPEVAKVYGQVKFAEESPVKFD